MTSHQLPFSPILIIFILLLTACTPGGAAPVTTSSSEVATAPKATAAAMLTPTSTLAPIATATPTSTIVPTATPSYPTDIKEVARSLNRLSPLVKSENASADDAIQLSGDAVVDLQDIAQIGSVVLEKAISIGDEIIPAGTELPGVLDKKGRLTAVVDPMTNQWQIVGDKRVVVQKEAGRDSYAVFVWWADDEGNDDAHNRGMAPIVTGVRNDTAEKTRKQLLKVLGEGEKVVYDTQANEWDIVDVEGNTFSVLPKGVETAKLYGDIDTLSGLDLQDLQNFITASLEQRRIDISDVDDVDVFIHKTKYGKYDDGDEWVVEVNTSKRDEQNKLERHKYIFIRRKSKTGEVQQTYIPAPDELDGHEYYENMYGGGQHKLRVLVEYDPQTGFVETKVRGIRKWDMDGGYTLTLRKINVERLLSGEKNSTEALSLPTKYMDRIGELPEGWQEAVKTLLSKYRKGGIIITPWVKNNKFGLIIWSEQPNGEYGPNSALYFIQDENGELSPNPEWWKAIAWRGFEGKEGFRQGVIKRLDTVINSSPVFRDMFFGLSYQKTAIAVIYYAKSGATFTSIIDSFSLFVGPDFLKSQNSYYDIGGVFGTEAVHRFISDKTRHNPKLRDEIDKSARKTFDEDNLANILADTYMMNKYKTIPIQNPGEKAYVSQFSSSNHYRRGKPDWFFMQDLIQVHIHGNSQEELNKVLDKYGRDKSEIAKALLEFMDVFDARIARYTQN